MKMFMSLSINIMRNLKYKYKFGLILLLFTLILSALSSVIICNYNVQISKVEKEIQGVKYNKALVELLYEVTEHKSLIIKDTREKDSASKDKLNALNTMLDKTYEKIKTFDKNMGNTLQSIERIYIEDSKTKRENSMVLLKKYIDKIKAEVVNRSWGNNTKYHDLITQEIFTSFLDVNYVSELVLDDRPDTSYFIDIACDVIPNLLVATLSTAELASEIAFEQYGTETQKQTLLVDLIEIKRYKKRLSDDLKRVISADASVENKIKEDYKKATANVDTLIKKINTKIIKTFEVKENPQTFYSLLNESRVSIKKLLDKNLNLLDSSLNKRLNAYKLQSGIVIGLIIISILVTMYLFMGFFLLVQDTINKIKKSAELMAQGDFRTKIDVQATDELGELAKLLNTTIDSLKGLIIEIHASSSDLDVSSAHIKESANQTATGAQQVATSIEQLVVGTQDQSMNVQSGLDKINEMNAAIQKISDNAAHSVELSKSTEQNADDGYNCSKKAVEVIQELKTSSMETANVVTELHGLSINIDKIVEMIKTIATQTNLLALNAAIEAARAGEQGKGFAVVADEVKKLANQSAEASSKITEMIVQVQSKTNNAVDIITQSVVEVEEGVEIIEDTGSKLHDILAAAKASGDQIEEISNEVLNLAKSSDQIVDMIDNISDLTEQSSAGAEEISAITQEQSANTQQITTNINNLVNSISKLVKSSSIFKT